MIYSREAHQTMVREAYERGLRDHGFGIERFENPFGFASHPDARSAWLRGWDAAEAKNAACPYPAHS